MSAYLISQILLFIYFYKNSKVLYEEIETINFAFYKLKIATLDLISYYIFKHILILHSYMTDINSQFN
jgi:hypothetical protein